MKKSFLLTVVVALIGLGVYIHLRPSEMKVSRSLVIGAPASKIFDQVNTLQNWQAWSPWARIDPMMKQTYEGPASGVGAVANWSGNTQVGEGRMTITEIKTDELVRFKLEFYKPFKANNTAEFTFKPEGDKTNVTWTMEGQKNFLMKALSLVINCDNLVGAQFEQGLDQLRTVVASGAR